MLEATIEDLNQLEMKNFSIELEKIELWERKNTHWNILKNEGYFGR